MTNRMSESGLSALREIDDGLAALRELTELLQGENDALRALLKEARDWLGSECLNEWPYMEGGRFYADRRDWLARIDALLEEGK